jgi:general secretion pathway protein D
VPFVSQVPVFGALFGSKENTTEKTELLVLITPRVIRNNEQARDVTRELRSRIDAFTPPKKEEKKAKP